MSKTGGVLDLGTAAREVGIHENWHILALGLIFAAADAFGIGSNDVANSVRHALSAMCAIGENSCASGCSRVLPLCATRPQYFLLPPLMPRFRSSPPTHLQFATSVGSGSLTLRKACIIAVFTEFTGAVLLGDGVTKTIKGSIIQLSTFDGQPDTLMVRDHAPPPRPLAAQPLIAPFRLMLPSHSGPLPQTPQSRHTAHPAPGAQLAMLCALVGSSLWVNTASRLGMAVSTSHSIVGATIGVGIAFRGPGTVLWGDARRGVLSIVLSWVISPLVAGCLGALMFQGTKWAVLAAADPHARSAQRTLRAARAESPQQQAPRCLL